MTHPKVKTQIEYEAYMRELDCRKDDETIKKAAELLKAGVAPNQLHSPSKGRTPLMRPKTAYRYAKLYRDGAFDPCLEYWGLVQEDQSDATASDDEGESPVSGAKNMLLDDFSMARIEAAVRSYRGHLWSMKKPNILNVSDRIYGPDQRDVIDRMGELDPYLRSEEAQFEAALESKC